MFCELAKVVTKNYINDFFDEILPNYMFMIGRRQGRGQGQVLCKHMEGYWMPTARVVHVPVRSVGISPLMAEMWTVHRHKT